MKNIISTLTGFAADAARFNDALIDNAFSIEPGFEPTKLEPFHQWMYENRTSDHSLDNLWDYLEKYQILENDGGFSDYAVSKGLAVKAYKQVPFAGEMTLRHQWYITCQGKVFINQFCSELKINSSCQN